MARRGRFGRVPRPAQSLTATLVSIAREMQSARDNNIMDAWRQGGTFEGHKVTDPMVLAHWKSRMADVAKDDPMYDTYKLAYDELDYSIAESKMTAAYAQGKIDDYGAAKFYLNWAKKVKKDSEFWRILQRDAAQYMRAAKAKGAAAAKRAAEERYQTSMKSIHDRDEAGGEYLLDTLKQLAQRGSRDGRIGALIGGPGSNSDLTQFGGADPNGQALGDTDAIMRLIDMITVNEGGPRRASTGLPSPGNPNQSVLFYDDNGQPVTGQSIRDEYARLAGGAFDGNITYDTVVNALDQKKRGLQARIALAEKTEGKTGDVKNLKEDLSYVNELGRQVNAWPVEQTYLEYRQDFYATVNNPNASAYDRANAITEYRSKLTRLAGDERIQTNDRLRNSLLGEADGRDGVVTAAEDFTGFAAPEGGGSEVARTNFEFENALNEIASVESGQAVWTTGETDDNGVFHPGAGGSRVGAATQSDISAASGGVRPRVIYVPDASGVPRAVTVMGQDIMAKAIDPVTGTAVTVTANVPIAQAYIVNGKTVYGFKVGGVEKFSTDPPWNPEKARLVPTANGFDLDLSNAVPPMDQRGTPGNGFSMQPASGDKVVLTMDPSVAAFSTEPEHVNGGYDPNTDFSSPMVAYLAGSGEGERQLLNLSTQTGFNLQLEHDIQIGAGATPQQDGTYVGGNTDAIGSAHIQTSMFTTEAGSRQRSWVRLSDLFDRSQAGLAITASEQTELATGRRNAEQTIRQGLTLASQAVKDSPFAAIASRFVNGTLDLLGPKPADDRKNPVIKSAQTITVPQLTPTTGFDINKATASPISRWGPTPLEGDTKEPAPIPADTWGTAFGSRGFGPNARSGPLEY